jgi:hypothetical protein
VTIDRGSSIPSVSEKCTLLESPCPVRLSTRQCLLLLHDVLQQRRRQQQQEKMVETQKPEPFFFYRSRQASDGGRHLFFIASINHSCPKTKGPVSPPSTNGGSGSRTWGGWPPRAPWRPCARCSCTSTINRSDAADRSLPPHRTAPHPPNLVAWKHYQRRRAEEKNREGKTPRPPAGSRSW